MIKKRQKKAQVWIETVVYTLIGLALISLILIVARPSIERQRDKTTIEQTINAMDELDLKIREIRDMGVSNVRIVDFKIKKGNLIIDGANEKVIFEIDSNYKYSEPGAEIPVPGTNLIVLTEKKPKNYKIKLSLNYAELDIVYNGEDIEKTLPPAQHKLSLENKGEDPAVPDDKIKIDIKEV